MTLEARNKRALAAGQAAYDNASPAEDDGREDYIEVQVDELMQNGECSLVPFFSTGQGPFRIGGPAPVDGFDVAGSEALADADTRDCELLQIVLACLNGEHEKAQKLAKFFEQPLRDAAANLVEKAMEQECDE